LTVAIIAFVCEFVAARNKQTKQQQRVEEMNTLCATRNDDCIIVDLENDSEAATEYQTAVEVTAIDLLSQIMQEEEDSESEDVTAGHNMITIVAEVHSHDESNIQIASQLYVN